MYSIIFLSVCSFFRIQIQNFVADNGKKIKELRTIYVEQINHPFSVVWPYSFSIYSILWIILKSSYFHQQNLIRLYRNLIILMMMMIGIE